MLRRTGLPRPVYVPPPPAPVRPAERRGVIAPITGCAPPVLKPPPARPGKRTPTVADREWMDFLVGYGCVACRLDGRGFVPCAVHHLLRGNRRIGHLATIGLCDPGHHQNGSPLGLISRHPWRAQFEVKYGTEESLLAHLRAMFLATTGRPAP